MHQRIYNELARVEQAALRRGPRMRGLGDVSDPRSMVSVDTQSFIARAAADKFGLRGLGDGATPATLAVIWGGIAAPFVIGGIAGYKTKSIGKGVVTGVGVVLLEGLALAISGVGGY